MAHAYGKVDNADYERIAAKLQEENDHLRRLLEERQASRATTPRRRSSPPQDVPRSSSQQQQQDQYHSPQDDPKSDQSFAEIMRASISRPVPEASLAAAIAREEEHQASSRAFEARLRDAEKDCRGLRNEIAQANEIAGKVEDALGKEIRDIRSAVRNLNGRI